MLYLSVPKQGCRRIHHALIKISYFNYDAMKAHYFSLNVGAGGKGDP